MKTWKDTAGLCGLRRSLCLLLCVHVCLHKCFSFTKTCCTLWRSLARGHLNIADQRVRFCLAASQVLCVLFFSSFHTHKGIDVHKYTHARTLSPPILLFFLGSTHLQPYYPESSAAAQLALHCWSVLLVTSAPSTRSPQCRSSGISPMENLLGIQKKPAHTCNCDGVFRRSLTALFFPAQSPDEKLFHLCSVINWRN